MKRIYFLVAGLLLTGTFTLKAQDTLLYESFNFQSFYDHLVEPGDLPGNATDSVWYNYDGDGLADGSPSSPARLGGWFSSPAFAAADTTNNAVIAANSWFDPIGQARNWLVTPSIQLGAADTLFWKSAPFETPRFLDGYKVYLSTGNNDDFGFIGSTTGHLLYTASEMTGIPVDGDTLFSEFDFSSPGYIHGFDGTYIQTPADMEDPAKAAYRGLLRPCSVPLDSFANQKVFIGFLHDSYDDNLISLDDILIRGQLPVVGINEHKNDLGLNVFPNPASDHVQVNYNLYSETNVQITVSDITGKVIASEDKGSQGQGRHFTTINTAELAKGFYMVNVKTSHGGSTIKLIVK